jgi:hypothetical protein
LRRLDLVPKGCDEVSNSSSEVGVASGSGCEKNSLPGAWETVATSLRLLLTGGTIDIPARGDKVLRNDRKQRTLRNKEIFFQLANDLKADGEQHNFESHRLRFEAEPHLQLGLLVPAAGPRAVEGGPPGWTPPLGWEVPPLGWAAILLNLQRMIIN